MKNPFSKKAAKKQDAQPEPVDPAVARSERINAILESAVRRVFDEEGMLIGSVQVEAIIRSLKDASGFEVGFKFNVTYPVENVRPFGRKP